MRRFLALGVLEGLVDFLGVDDSPLDQNFAQLLLLFGHGVRSRGLVRTAVLRRAEREGFAAGSLP